jgi:hypothetical protein
LSVTPQVVISTADLVADEATINLADLVAGATDATVGDTVSIFDGSVSIAAVPSTSATLSVCDYIGGTCTIDFSLDSSPQQLALNFTMTDGVNLVENQVADVVLILPGPTLIDDTLTLDQVGIADIDANDFNLPVTYGLAIDTAASVGTATVNDDGTITYSTTAAPFTGDSFTYCLTSAPGDDLCLASPPVATVTIDPAPTSGLIAVGGKTFNIDEDAILDVLAVNGLLSGESPINGGTLAVVVDSAPSCANTAAGSFTYDGTTGAFHYEPLLDWNSVNPPVDDGDTCTLNDDGGARGADTIVYHFEETYDDGGNLVTISSNTVTAEITVNPVNDAPVAQNISLYLQNASTTVLDQEGQPTEVTFSIAPPGVLTDVTDLENDGLIATEVNDPDNNDPAISIDGGVTPFFVDNNNLGVLGSVEFQVSDVVGATSHVAQADLVRLVTVTRVSYVEAGNPNNDDWRLRGVVDSATIPNSGGVQGVRVFLNKVNNTDNITIDETIEIVPTATNNNNGRIRRAGGVDGVWSINANNVGNSPIEPDSNDTLRIEVIGFTDAIYENVPISIE